MFNCKFLLYQNRAYSTDKKQKLHEYYKIENTIVHCIFISSKISSRYIDEIYAGFKTDNF